MTAQHFSEPTGVTRAERGARAAWSRIAEPADERALALVTEHGAAEALRLVLSGDSRAPEVFRMRADRFGLETDPGGQLAVARAIGATVLCPGDPEWPERLADHPLPPLCLWVLGSPELAALAERVLLALVRAGDVSVERDRDVASELAHGSSRVAVRGGSILR